MTDTANPLNTANPENTTSTQNTASTLNTANPQRWHKIIPWYITGISTIALLLVGFYLYLNMEWFKNSATDNVDLLDDAKYRIFIYSAHLSMVKRSLGIITGVAITFIGLGVSFYALEKAAEVDVSGLGKLTTFSPGLFAIFFGCFLISQSISSKDTMEFGKSQPKQEQTATDGEDTGEEDAGKEETKNDKQQDSTIDNSKSKRFDTTNKKD